MSLIVTLSACGGSESPDPEVPPEDSPPDDDLIGEASCPRVQIIDLSQDDDNFSCATLPGKEGIADCVAEEIRALPAACLTEFDVFVPGTAAEAGDWKQFNSMFNRDTGRGYLSLKYGEGDVFDGAEYDRGVKEGRESLDLLLYTLNTRFDKDGEEPDIRVFGHSKGSHAVALVSEQSEFSNIDFYAFAQPGRTGVDIDSRADIVAGKVGDPGYISKLSSNLVGITWKNDEVQYYTGLGYGGLELPEKWSFPGYIHQDTYNGANPWSFRIDHHNNYGGSYTDGIGNNDPTAGEGSTKDGYPYCATGNSFFGSYSECEKKDTTYHPYFWGDEGCRNKAFEMMESSSTGSKYYIGYSGKRGANCKENESTISAEYELWYLNNIGDNKDGDCKIEVEIQFGGVGDRPDGGNFSISATDKNQSAWRSKKGTTRVAQHMTLRVTTRMEDTSGYTSECGGALSGYAKTEVYISSLKLKFKHPTSGVTIDRTIIGLDEGLGYPVLSNLDLNNDVGWYETRDDNDYHIYRSTAGLWNRNVSSLMLKGDTKDGAYGRVYKRVHLVD